MRRWWRSISQGNGHPSVGQLHAVIRRIPHIGAVRIVGQMLEHRGDRGGFDAKASGQVEGRGASGLLLLKIDLLEIVLLGD